MRISGTKPSSVILGKNKFFFSEIEKRDAPNVPKQAEAKRDGVINPHNYNFKQFQHEKFDAFKRYESTEVDRRIWLHVPSGTRWSTSNDTHQVIEI